MVIYLITNTINGKLYVGQAKSLERRWGAHCNSTRRGCKYLIHCAMRKYGPAAFTTRVLVHASTQQELDEQEIVWIILMDSKAPHGYNMTDGGGGCNGRVLSAQTRRKIGIGNKGKLVSEATRRRLSRAIKSKLQNDPEYRARVAAWNHSQEHRDRISAANSKRECAPSTREKLSQNAKRRGFGHRKGWHPSEETCQKMSESANRKPPITEETRRRISAGHVGIHPTLETRQKMSESAKRRPPFTSEHRQKLSNGMRGKHLSEETRHKISLANTGGHRTEETKQKMREARKLQAPASEATRQRMRESSAARWSRPEEHQKISDKLTGRKLDSHKPETIAKMKAAWALRKQRLAA
jgi:group I intron endonuclease